jgi:energy-coupling factor transporter ATP-binding protein EcfA2
MGLDGLTITASPGNNTLLIETSGRQGKLSDVGSGIAHVLVTLAHAVIGKPRMIAIDEPETGLHPALQRSFLEALGNVASHGVLFTTHSMGIARTEADRCYTVHRSDSIVRLYEKTAHLSEVLGSLGIAAIQDLAYTRLLLVEGQTDVRVFKRLLALYNLDRDTVVLSLGGSTLIRDGVAEEMAEVMRICPNTRVIFDSERPSATSAPPKDRERFAKICADLELPYCMTEFRATDNYFTQSAIDAALGAGHVVRLGSFEKLAGQWGKTENWRIAAATTREELDRTDIGRFLADWACSDASTAPRRSTP